MNIALLYIKQKTASTVYDHVEAFKQYSHHKVFLIDIGKYSPYINLELLNKFDVVIIHYCIPTFLDSLLSPEMKMAIRFSRAKKVIFIQDEYHIIDIMNFMKVDILYTCVPESEIEKVYPKARLPHTKKINTLTGFVPEALLKRSRLNYEERPIDVVYRGRKVPKWLGRLGQEKEEIGDMFLGDAEYYDLKCDISSKEEDRIYEDKWINFISHSKCSLGCESGSSVFDFTGDIQKKVEKYELDNPYATFEEVQAKFFLDLEGKIYLNQISPRAFESAALGTLMILYEGEYSGILKPWKHYVPLKKDHSNMEEVVSVIRDPQKWREITDRAYQEVACNPKYSYKHFITLFDKDIKKEFGDLSLSGCNIKHLGTEFFLKFLFSNNFLIKV